MATLGPISCTGDGAYPIGSTVQLVDFYVALTVPGLSKFVSTVAPRRVLSAGWYAIGFEHWLGDPGNPPLVTLWKWLDFEYEDPNTIAWSGSAGNYLDTFFWHAEPTVTFEITVNY